MTTVRPLTQDDVRRLTVITEPWLSCEDCFDGVDVFVEEVLSGSTPVSEDFRVHLLGCSVCREEAMSLATLAGPGLAIEAAAAGALLDAAVGR
jgi:hypothetical protein